MNAPRATNGSERGKERKLGREVCPRPKPEGVLPERDTMVRLQRVFWLALMLAVGAGCREKKSEHAAEAASALVPSRPASDQALPFSVDGASSKVSFLMEAPIEKISGEAPGALDGELFVDASDVGRSTGLVKVDLEKLVLYQEKRDNENAAFTEKKKNDLQNQHARTWLEISSDAPSEVREANRFAEFRITRLENPSIANVAAQAGAERKLTATVVGDLRLHGRKKEQRAKVEVAFTFAGDKPTQVRVRTLEPMPVSLEDYDVRPREAFGKLAQKTLDALGSKVARVAPIQLEFTANAK
jgi:polyisoprenoid-binding protein YceI